MFYYCRTKIDSTIRDAKHLIQTELKDGQKSVRSPLLPSSTYYILLDQCQRLIINTWKWTPIKYSQERL